ncbi:DUF3467 domain-containing protein [Leifsonia sp. NPDC058194]|uniref:DUF3467 domain-containing protein n=1 Tax=Leifsonia sp. NPDC058194 TaxID=3346374 RepID=UPI0036DA25FC
MPDPQQLVLQMGLPDSQEVGVYADFANIWHTPNSFVLDFLTVKMPPHPQADPQSGQPLEDVPGVLETTVSARVRIPPEQIFPLMAGLQQQANQWLQETGRQAPPEVWDPTQPPSA